jgi:hypothetical protein
MFGRWRTRHGDSRGEGESDEDRYAPPVAVVEAEGVAMSGPAGAPQEDLTPDERRERDRSTSA